MNSQRQAEDAEIGRILADPERRKFALAVERAMTRLEAGERFDALMKNEPQWLFGKKVYWIEPAASETIR